MGEASNKSKKVKIPPYLINYALHSEDIGSGGTAPPFLASSLDGSSQLHVPSALAPAPIPIV
jgi:hypothetical protein